MSKTIITINLECIPPYFGSKFSENVVEFYVVCCGDINKTLISGKEAVKHQILNKVKETFQTILSIMCKRFI